jgi:hypothetical protein
MPTNSPFQTPSSWANGPLILYHGTLRINGDSILRGVELRRGRADADFGRGFYTTTVWEHAVQWAKIKAQIDPGNDPIIVAFEVDRDQLAALEFLCFVRADPDASDFWNLVFRCLRQADDHHRAANQGWYDIVIGPLVKSYHYRATVDNSEQISFHTDRAVNLLNRSTPRTFQC